MGLNVSDSFLLIAEDAVLSRTMLHLLRSPIGTEPTNRHVCFDGKYWRVSGPSLQALSTSARAA
jgi:hypothetical protein